MSRRTNIIKLIGYRIATNYEIGLEITPIICRQSFFILLHVAFLSKMFIFGSQNLINHKFFKKMCIQQFYFAISFSKCFCDTPFFQISNFWTQKMKTQITETLAKFFAYTKSEYLNFFVIRPC